MGNTNSIDRPTAWQLLSDLRDGYDIPYEPARDLFAWVEAMEAERDEMRELAADPLRQIQELKNEIGRLVGERIDLAGELAKERFLRRDAEFQLAVSRGDSAGIAAALGLKLSAEAA